MKTLVTSRRVLLVSSIATVILICAPNVWPQAQNQYDKGTPPQFAAGVSSFGSYTSADVGTVNLSNGALNLKLPLGVVGGRGMSLPITLNWSSKIWSASIDYDREHGPGRGGLDDPNPSMVPLAYAEYNAAASYASFNSRLEAGWTIGGMPFITQRIVRINYTEFQSQGPCYHWTLPKITFTSPDGGEIEFRDDAYDGTPSPSSDCGGWTGIASRGHRWHATNGSGWIYVTDLDNGGSLGSGSLAGVVISADGTRYYIGSGGGCYLIKDRNGNQISVDNDGGIVDPLGRTTTIQQNVADPETGEALAVLVTMKGYGGGPRYYKVKSGTMNEHYRSGINPGLPVVTGSYDPMSWGYNAWWPTSATRLFPFSYGLFAQRIDNWPVIYELILPDHRSMHFNYNEFGEVAEVQLPTGGKVWYDYGPAAGLPSGNSAVFETAATYHTTVDEVDRAVVRRRTFPDGGTLEGTWNYSYGAPTTTVTCSAADGTLMSNQVHFFLPAQRYTDAPQSSVGLHDGTYYNLWSTGVEYRSETRDDANNVIAASEQDWAQRAAVSWPVYTQEQPANDNRVNHTRHYLDNGSYSKTDTFYDDLNYPRANNVSEVREYDFDQTLKRRATTTYVTGSYQSDDSIHLVSLASVQTVYDGNGNQAAQTTNEYDNYAEDGSHLPLSYHDYGAVVGHDGNFGSGLTTRGNLTATGQWLNTNGSTIYSYLRYDTLGNMVGAKDAKGNLSEVSFVDDFGDGSNPGAGGLGAFGATYALPTLITSPPPQPGQPQQTARTQYDFYTGLLTGFRDRNNVVSQTIYNDPFNRPTQVKSALGISGTESHAAMYYAPATVFGITLTKNDVLTAKDRDSLDDAVLRAWTHTDGFGRTVQSFARDPQGDTEVATVYDAMGRANQTSNPFRPTLSENPIYTTTLFDLAGRARLVTTPDSSSVTTSYTANTVTVTDQDGNQRASVTDGLGRLVKIYESPNGPNLLTSYTYDTLDNLTGVSQVDTETSYNQTRTFNYDSLKRLTSAANPESGTVTYEYDTNGNLKVKTDARLVSAHYDYDALNRIIRRWYNGSNDLSATNNNSPLLPSYVGGSDEIKYSYDAQVPSGAPAFNRGYSTGRLIAVTYGNNATGDYLGYDATGQANVKVQLTGSVPYAITASYNRAGAMTTETYPSTRTVSYGYDVAGRTNSFSGSLGGGNDRPYSSNISYSSLGGLRQEQIGTAIPNYNKLFYNSRGQLAEIREGLTANNDSWQRGAIINFYSTCWGMCGGSNSTSPMLHNNGNLRTQQVFLPGPNEANYDTVGYHFFTQHYGYDSLNRLQSVDETFDDGAVNWHQNYAYDRYGNRTLDPATSGVNNTAFDKNEARFTNRIYAPGDTALPMIQRQMQYDSAGNLINDNYTGQGLHTYDAENRMTSSAGVSAGVYFYDGDGHRIKRTVGGVETWQVYGLGGELIAEYPANGSQGSPQKEYGYRNGQLLITATPATAGWGPAPPIDDNPLNPPGQPKTDVKAIHITQLRSAINALRAHYNLPNYPWQKPTASGGAINNTVYVSWEPIDEMRTALNEALGPPSTPYAGGLAAGQPILKDHIQELRDRVLASWNSGSTALDIHWMVTDQLRTPRMVFDLSGSLVATSRHDYLPFGEEIYANTGGRLMAQGYPTPQNALDSTRQKFTEKERDIETGLDYFGARYYSSVQGRFISVDPARKSIIPQNPQSWNRYTYAYNNPLALIDNNGKWPTDTHNYIIATAFNGLSPQKVRQIQEGSASVDGSFKKLVNQPIRLLTQNTLLESEAFKHAMTPGALVRQFNGDVGRAKQEATKLMNAFIDERMGAAQRTFQAGENRNGVNNAALTTFGEGAHPIMDNVSPQHAGMQVYDLAPYFKTYQKYAKWGIPEVGATLAIKDYKNDMDEHSAGEARMPTTDEMNVMVDQLRMRYLQTFGREEYERAVTADEREKTERRLKGQR